MSAERIDPNDRLLVTAQRALGLVESHGGIGGNKNTRVARTMDVALVELMVANIREGFVQRPEYLRRPAHLPDTDKELRVLALSEVPKDQTLRADLYEWASINRRLTSQGSVTLRNAIMAIRFADVALNASDENDAEIHAWKLEIEKHLVETYAIEPASAPAALDELGLWCEKALTEFNPVPEWLREARPSSTTSGTIFKPKTKPDVRKIIGGDDE